MEKLKETLENLSITNEEAKKLNEAFKNEEFKKLFREYAEELQDPENRRKYEEELTLMEQERGMDVEFINPSAGHVLKTIQNGNKKIFINICQSDKIEKAVAKKAEKSKTAGLNWSIPHSFTPPRNDLDKKREECLIYDVVFNPETYKLGEKDRRFRNMLHDTAMEGLEKMFKVTVDKVNYKVLKMKMKGQPTSTIIRHKRSDFEAKQTELLNNKDDLSFPYPCEPVETKKEEYLINEEDKKKAAEPEGSYNFTKPEYHVKYSNKFDILNFVGQNNNSYSPPDTIIVEVKLPLLNSAKGIDLDINRKQLKLSVERPAKYLLELQLTYPVMPDKGTAKFDKSKKLLVLTIPIEKTDTAADIQSQLVEQDSEKDVETVAEEEKVDEQSTSLVQEMKETEEAEQNVEIEPVDDSKEKVVDTLEKKKNEEIKVSRIAPRINPQFRQTSDSLYVMLDIKNVRSDCCTFFVISNKPVSSQNEGQYQTVVEFNCQNRGQGGWDNFYSVPIKFLFSEPSSSSLISTSCEGMDDDNVSNPLADVMTDNVLLKFTISAAFLSVEILDHVFVKVTSKLKESPADYDLLFGSRYTSQQDMIKKYLTAPEENVEELQLGTKWISSDYIKLSSKFEEIEEQKTEVEPDDSKPNDVELSDSVNVSKMCDNVETAADQSYNDDSNNQSNNSIDKPCETPSATEQNQLNDTTDQSVSCDTAGEDSAAVDDDNDTMSSVKFVNDFNNEKKHSIEFNCNDILYDLE